MKRILLFVLCFFVFEINLFSQGIGNGSDGSPNISGIVNTYSSVTNISSNSCQSILTVNTNLGFSVGDLVLIIQMQGAAIDTTNTSNYGLIQNDSSSGLFEYATITAITSNTIYLNRILTNIYQISGKVQLIRIPQYKNPTINGILTCLPWNGNVGGVLAIDAIGKITFSDSIDVSGKGFRGGQIITVPTNPIHVFNYNSTYQPAKFAAKGEGISGNGLNPFIYGKGSPANGGGGGNAVNAGGGGGGNYGCGGKGGDGFTSPAYGSSPNLANGEGGKSLTYNTLRAVMGGGGGAAHENDNHAFDGGNGGGIVIINADTINGLGKKINSNGISPGNSTNDGGSGGGAGGSIILLTNYYASLLNINATGGNGANTTDVSGYHHGPGGGGGGGFIRINQSSLPTNLIVNINGGAKGLASGFASGTVDGCVGGVKYNLQLPTYISTNLTSSIYDTICKGDSVNISINVTATNITWTPANSISCTNCISPTVYPSNNTTYIASSFYNGCYHLDSFQIVVNNINLSSSNDTIINIGSSVQLNSFGMGVTSYSWQPSVSLNNSSINNPIATPNQNTTYFVSAVNSFGCISKDTIIVSINFSPTISGIINQYTEVQSISQSNCVTQISVASTNGFQLNDLVLIMQMQGAIIDTTNSVSYGTITNNSTCGKFEFSKITNISGNTILLNNLSNSYNVLGHVQLIKVPQYKSTIISGAITSPNWNGTTGGVIVINATNKIVLNNNINGSGKGFRGGITAIQPTLSSHLAGYTATFNPSNYAAKGEGIGGFGVNSFNYATGAPANGGGGGNRHNGGGGGGSNLGCGGNGGDAYNNPVYGSNSNLAKGLGGHTISSFINNNTVFLGGGGGAGHQNDFIGGNGADGGGIIIINTDTLIGNNNFISANGNTALNAGIDGASGGGGGGSILIQFNKIFSTLNVEAKGGNGGNCTQVGGYSPGAGGGGGGGVVFISQPLIPVGLNINTTNGIKGLASGVVSTQTDGCKGDTLFNLNLALNNNLISKSTQTISICQNDTAVLQLNAQAHHITWNPTTNLSCTNCISPKAYPSSSTIYIATDSINHCFSRDTFVVNTYACLPCKGTFNFNGANEVQLPLPDTSYYPSNGFTWECWFKAPYYNTQDSSLQPGHSLLIVEDAVACEDIVINFGWTGVKRTYLGFVVDGPGGCANRDINPCIYKPSAGFIPNKWYHVAGVKSYTANTTMLYVDGILVDTKSNTKTPLLRNIRTRISSIPVGVDSGFVGKIDEVRMWNYARTSTEIFNQYNTCLSGNESGLLAYYKANEGKGLTAFDAAAFRGYNDGTASVNTIWDSTDNAPIIPQNCVGSYSPIIQSNSPICNNDTFKVKVIGILPSSCKYQWIGANNFISAQKNITLANAKAGKYFLTITDTINKCNSMFYDSVQLVLLSPTHKTISSSICQGKNYTMPSGKIITSAGVYYDTIVNHNGCDSIITIQLKLSSSSISVDSAIICQGNTYILPSGKVVSVASVYSDTIINHLGCDSVISFKLKLLPNNNKTTHASICFGKLYTLPNGSQVNTSGTYIMYQKNKNGCDSNLIIHLTTLSNTYSIINKNICQGDIFILPNGDTAAISGTYFTTIKNYVGCDSTIQTVIQTIANNRFNLGNDTSICAFDSVELSIKNGNDLQGNYWWNIGGNSNKITIKNEGLIIAMASNPPCPTVSDSIIITYANCDCNYYMPNAFSPNADNLNDIIKPIFECNPQPTNYTFTIYNRWGQKVFETTDINTGWDGVFKLKQQEVGVYDYYIQYQTPNLFKSTTHKGNISLIR